MARIELQNLRKAWGDVIALESMNLTIEDGEFVAILGPSGCGKSTTLFLLAGIYAPTSGDLKFDGHVVNLVEARDRNVGVVFQSYALYPHMTVRKNIMYPLRFIKGVSNQEAVQRTEEAAKMVHVSDLLDRRPGEMSGGQQQRVALARALVKEPQLLLLDEPLSNLDATLRLTMRIEIKSLQRQLGVTTILVTHDQVEATTMADRIICMSKGRIEQIGSPSELYKAPASLFVAGFIGAPPINLINAEAENGIVRINNIALTMNQELNGSISVGIRPEHIQFGDTGLGGKVREVEPMGRETLYLVDTPLGALRVLEHGAESRYMPGDQAAVAFSMDDTLVFDNKTERLIPGTRIDMRDEHLE